MWYKPSQFVFYWFFFEKKKERFWGQVNLGNLPAILLSEDLQSIEHVTSRGACFNWIKCISTSLTSEPCSLLCVCTHVLHCSSVGNSWWCRLCCTLYRGLGQRTPQYEDQILNFCEMIPWFWTESKQSIQIPVLCLAGFRHFLCQLLMACGKRLILHENIIRTDLRSC